MSRAVAWVARLLMALSMGLILLMAVHVAGSVAFRWITGRDIPLTLEITASYYMVALTFLPLALIDLSQRHIRAEFLSTFLPMTGQQLTGILVRSAMLLYLGLLTWRSFRNAADRTRAGDELITIMGYMPTWPARWFVPFGLAVATAAALVLLVRALAGRDDRPDPALPESWR